MKAFDDLAAKAADRQYDIHFERNDALLYFDASVTLPSYRDAGFTRPRVGRFSVSDGGR